MIIFIVAVTEAVTITATVTMLEVCVVTECQVSVVSLVISLMTLISVWAIVVMVTRWTNAEGVTHVAVICNLKISGEGLCDPSPYIKNKLYGKEKT